VTFETYNQIPLVLWDVVAASKKVMKAWGWEFWIFNTALCSKLLLINPGFRCSLHYHPVKEEVFTVLTGTVMFEQRDVRGYPIEEILSPGTWRAVYPKTPHRFGSIDGALLLETSTRHDDADVVRITESGKIPDAVRSRTSVLTE
jgi:mannose-6-phosphate isomerase-like protein (cupin superfamily)